MNQFINTKSISTLFITLELANPVKVYGQVLINEFSSNNELEWVELINTTSETVDITSWTISDEKNDPFSLTGSINGNSYYIFETQTHWLNNTGGDSIVLKDKNSSIIDSVIFGRTDSVVGSPSKDKSAGRAPDGGGSWTNNLTPSKNQKNPEPTLSPTKQPQTTPPTESPEPTTVNTPSATVQILSATDKPTPKPSQKPKSYVSSRETSLTPTNGPIVETENSDLQSKIIPGAMMGLGAIFIGAAAFPFIKSELNKRKDIITNDKEIH